MENKINSIKDIINSITALLEEKIIDSSEDYLKEFKSKLFDIFDYYFLKIDKINFNFLTNNLLTNILNQLNGLNNSLTNFFINNNNNNYFFTNAKSCVDNIVPLFNDIPDLNKDTIGQNLNQIIKNFKSNFNKINNNILNKEKYFEKEIETCKETIFLLKEENEKLSKKIKKQDMDIIECLNNFSTEFNNKQNSRNQEFFEQKTNIESDYKSLIEKQEKIFNESLKKNQEQFQILIDKKSEEYDVYKKCYEEETKVQLDILNKNKTKSEELLGIIGKNTYAGNYKIYADKSKVFANWLFWISFAIMIFVAFCLAIPLLYQIHLIFTNKTIPDIDFWKSLAYRVPTLFVLLLPAFYLSIEAKKQREKEFKYRDFEIKISAISPYMNDIRDSNNSDICEKDKVKLELAKVFFGEIYKEKLNDNIIIPKDLVNLINSLTDKIVKIKGKK